MKQNDIDWAIEKVECHLPKNTTIAVGMSGGVDSAVAAALLRQSGYTVIGLFMKNWDEGDSCPAEQDAQDVAKVAKIINIPFYTVSFAKEYKEQVFDHFLRELQAGVTPNPDILCNREVKFKLLLEKALSIGADSLATGHYARNRPTEHGYLLEKADDPSKDQSYFLYTATQASLQKTVFPLAGLQKKEVRRIASILKLPVATKKDSTGICFIGERNFREFLKPFLGNSPGPMISVEGKILGQHVGLAYYTIGQRKGLGIGGPGDAWFVVEKDISSNTLLVAQGENHPALFTNHLVAHQPHWVSGTAPSFPFSCTAKIRYRQEDRHCTVHQKDSNTLEVYFPEPQRAVTPQQSIVFYDKNVCLGGAFISYAGKRDVV
jgi:tRNA-specific 2-thiouridylase